MSAVAVPLADVERSRLVELEAVVGRGLQTFVEVGQALLEIRDSRLYRETHETFEAYCRERWGFSRAHAYRLMDGAAVAELVSPIGDITNEAQARALVPILRDGGEQAVVDAYRELRAEHGEALTARDVRSWRGLVSSESNEWYTPAEYVEAAREVMGGIDLDPASCADANETVAASRFYSREDDGLSQPWFGRVWLNPPYGGAAGAFVARLADSYAAGEVESAVVLVSAGAVGTSWFRPLWEHKLCFTDHRIRFQTPGRDGTANNHSSVFAYLGPHHRGFTEVFSEYGYIVGPRELPATATVVGRLAA